MVDMFIVFSASILFYKAFYSNAQRNQQPDITWIDTAKRETDISMGAVASQFRAVPFFAYI